MINKSTTLSNNAPSHKSRGYLKKLSIFSIFGLMLFAFMAGCKKDDFTGEIIGKCPVVVSTVPLDLAVDVNLNQVISATFNTDMDATTITSSTFIVKQGNAQISGVVAPTADAKTFTFTPSTPLDPFIKYTGTITTGAKDTLRTAMENDYVWTFTTIPQVTLSAAPVIGGTTTGAGNFAQGSTVTVVATPNPGYVFINWTKGGVIASTSASYPFVMNGNIALVANFEIVPINMFAVNVSSSPVAGGTTTGGGSYNAGESVTLTATPSAGYVFTNFTEGGVIVSSSSSIQFFVTANRTFVANFSLTPTASFTLNVTANPIVGGTTTGQGPYPSGTSVTVTATPSAGYVFTNFTEGGTVVSTTSPYNFVLNGNRTLVANFSLAPIPRFTVAVTSNPVAGGDVTGDGTFDTGAQVRLIATAKPGYTFTNFTENGTIVSTQSPYNFILTGNRTLVANFTLVPISNFTVNISANPLIGGSPSGGGSYQSGSPVSLIANPNPGYTFTNFTENGAIVSSNSPFNFNITSNRTFVANYALIPPVVLPAVILKTASRFGAFGGNAGVTNQGINTRINNGGIGTTAASTLITGFHDALTGDVYTETPLNKGRVSDGIFTAPPAPGNAVKEAIATQALLDARAAYISISPAAKPGGTDPGAGELGGLTLAPGTYMSAGGTFKITNGDLTLDAKGNPNAQWFFQAGTSLTVGIAGPAGARSVKLIGGALAKNVFWYVGSAATINAAGGGTMVGNIISTAGVTFSTAGNAAQTVLDGRAISLVASVTMVNTTINVPAN